MSDMHKMNKNNIFDFVLTLPAEGSVFHSYIPASTVSFKGTEQKIQYCRLGNACIQYIQLKMFISDGMKK